MKMNKFFSTFAVIALAVCVWQTAFITAVPHAKAGLWENQQGLDQISPKFSASGKDPRDVREIAANIIKIFLTLLGIIFLILIIAAGFKWMTASGNEEKAKEAQSQIKLAIIGMIIIIAAYVITSFVFEKAASSIGGGGADGFSGYYDCESQYQDCLAACITGAESCDVCHNAYAECTRAY